MLTKQHTRAGYATLISSALTLKLKGVNPEIPPHNCSRPKHSSILHASETTSPEFLEQQLWMLPLNVGCEGRIDWHLALHVEVLFLAAPLQGCRTWVGPSDGHPAWCSALAEITLILRYDHPHSRTFPTRQPGKVEYRYRQ